MDTTRLPPAVGVGLSVMVAAISVLLTDDAQGVRGVRGTRHVDIPWDGVARVAIRLVEDAVSRSA